MQKIFVIIVTSIALVGCSTPAERDEARFVDSMRAYLGSQVDFMSDTELLDAGDGLCDAARDSEKNMADAFAAMAEVALREGASESTMEYLRTLSASAEVFLCPELA